MFGLKDMNEVVKWLTNLNSVVMPMRYLWVFFAYMLLNKAYKQFNSEYKFVKILKLVLCLVSGVSYLQPLLVS